MHEIDGYTVDLLLCKDISHVIRWNQKKKLN